MGVILRYGNDYRYGEMNNAMIGASAVQWPALDATKVDAVLAVGVGCWEVLLRLAVCSPRRHSDDWIWCTFSYEFLDREGKIVF